MKQKVNKNKNNGIIIFLLFLTSNLYGQFVQCIGIKSGISIANQTWKYNSNSEKKKNITGFYFVASADFFNNFVT